VSVSSRRSAEGASVGIYCPCPEAGPIAVKGDPDTRDPVGRSCGMTSGLTYYRRERCRSAYEQFPAAEPGWCSARTVNKVSYSFHDAVIHGAALCSPAALPPCGALSYCVGPTCPEGFPPLAPERLL